MKLVAPDYYKAFRCTAADCAHSCCIGWEIDIDPETLALYSSLEGELGHRLSCSIERGEDGAHFILDEGERCPFLNATGLCDIISTLGEEGLCQICDDHPRYRNDLSDRCEVGLGMCCEAAAALILSCPHKVRLVTLEQGEEHLSEEQRQLLILRDQLVDILQDRTLSVDGRIEAVLSRLGTFIPEGSVSYWVQELLALERLDPAWTEVLDELAEYTCDTTAVSGFETAFEQFSVYLAYRYFASCRGLGQLRAYGRFIWVSYRVISALCRVYEDNHGTLTLAVIAELCRMFSAEVEYSSDNMERMLFLTRDE